MKAKQKVDFFGILNLSIKFALLVCLLKNELIVYYGGPAPLTEPSNSTVMSVFRSVWPDTTACR